MAGLWCIKGLWFLDPVLAHRLCSYLVLVSLLGWTSWGTEAPTTGWHPLEGLWDKLVVSVAATASPSHLLETKPKTFHHFYGITVVTGS